MLQATTTDTNLLMKVKDWRSDEGWREFHKRYAPAIMVHARERGLTHEEAEDVVQTTMVKVATYIPSFEYDKTVCRFRTWLNQVVNQRMLAIWRERTKLRLPEKAWMYLSEQIEESAPTVEDPREQTEMTQRLLELCLNRLRASVSPRHWQLFEANVLLGLSGAETAKKYGSTTANVWVVRHRLTRRLRKEWVALREYPYEN